MAWSYRKRIRIIPGVHLNISRRGISTTIGVKGASLNFGPRGTYLNTGIPGSGLYNRQRISPARSTTPQHIPQDVAVLEPASRGNIFSVAPDEVTSNDMQGIKDTIIAAHQQKKELTLDLEKVKMALASSRLKLTLSYIFLIGWIVKKVSQQLKDAIAAQQNAIHQISEQLENSSMTMDVEFDEGMKGKFDALSEAFKRLSAADKVWDVTSAVSQNRVAARSAASTLIERRQVSIGIRNIPDISAAIAPLWLKNANGADLYFYPAFLIMYDSRDQFGIIGYDELDFDYGPIRFVEDGPVPRDTQVIDRTWAKVNRDGSRDKRFKDNYQIPIVKYGRIKLRTRNGMHEEYDFSNYEATELFSNAFLNYVKALKS
ncbi:DUF4236 domain-containing protein [Chitinophaga rhizophila]|uniref:DUF4236 domain-containing protein n=1 Tax=Chitinophaga rhizophila TaxID=2866212 RepID=A0ABS7G869_9BACT|nr:DUF4236 domain-containing protein [Chitinophaga rhizophila]MBW8683861.1 DUF4236 domain-containing protein [Chitinophaga rhizophila]